MTPDVAFGGYSTVSDYKVMEACMDLLPSSDEGTSTKTEVVHGTATEELLAIATGTSPITPSTIIFGSMEASQLVAVSVTPMLPLVRHQSDIRETGSANTASTQATSTSNAPAKVA